MKRVMQTGPGKKQLTTANQTNTRHQTPRLVVSYHSLAGLLAHNVQLMLEFLSTLPKSPGNFCL